MAASGETFQSKPETSRVEDDEKMKTAWVKYLIIALIFEKIIQHIMVTLAFSFNWMDIGSTVAVNPRILMILGAIVAVFFMISLWGMLSQQKWATGLVILLALFDILGEFMAQGTIGIVITVSFLVAVILLILALIYRRGELKTEK